MSDPVRKRAVANRVFGKDALKPIIEELNEVLVA